MRPDLCTVPREALRVRHCAGHAGRLGCVRSPSRQRVMSAPVPSITRGGDLDDRYPAHGSDHLAVSRTTVQRRPVHLEDEDRSNVTPGQGGWLWSFGIRERRAMILWYRVATTLERGGPVC